MAEVVNLMEKSEEKKKALEAALSQIEKNYGKGSVMKLGDPDNIVEIEAISTGSLGLDIALGIGGLRAAASSKCTGRKARAKPLALHTVAEAQKVGGICGFIDAEHALDPTYANKLGVQIEDLLISQPDNGEQALEIADTLVRRAGRRDGRQPAGPAGAADEPGAAQADRHRSRDPTPWSSSSTRSA